MSAHRPCLPQTLAERASDLLSAVDDIDVAALAQQFCEQYSSKIGPGDWYDPDHVCDDAPPGEYCDRYVSGKVSWRDQATSTGAPACTDRVRNDLLISDGARTPIGCLRVVAVGSDNDLCAQRTSSAGRSASTLREAWWTRSRRRWPTELNRVCRRMESKLVNTLCVYSHVVQFFHAILTR